MLNPDAGVVEVHEYSLREDVEEKAFLTASTRAELAMSECEGYVSRELLQGRDGYLDVVRWERPADADAAIARREESGPIATLFGLLDEESLSRRRFSPMG